MKKLNLYLKKQIQINQEEKNIQEFISAAIQKKEFLKEEKLLDLFKTLDKDGSGKISKRDIKKVLNNEDINENNLDQFIVKFDLNGDGEIDYEEFISNMNEIDKDNN